MKKFVSFTAAAAMAAAMAISAVTPAMADSSDSSITIAIDNDISTLHPSDFSTSVELNVLNQIYDTLVFMNSDGTGDMEPRLATSWEISEDGMEYTFHLRDDVSFQNGTPLTADDVVFSLELYMNSEYQEIRSLESAEAVDDYTVVCHLDSAYAAFPLYLSRVHIASKDYYEESEEDFINKPIGTGPYKYVDRTIGSSVTLTANEDYYRGTPSIKDITFEVIPDATTTAIGLQTGDINFTEVDYATIPQLEANPDISIEKVPTSTFAYVTMNTEKAPFDNVLVRQAINYALNRDNIVLVCYEGEATANSSLCSPERFGYPEDLEQYTYDPEKAAELLTEAGIETPYDLGTILVAEQYSNLATVIQNDLRQVGLEVTIDTKEFNSYISSLTSGDYGISVLKMTLEGDTQSLEMAFITDYIGTANNARYSDAEMDELFTEARTETDTEKRAELFHQIFTKAQEEAIYAPICNPLSVFAFNSSLNVPEIQYEGYYYVFDFSWN